MAKKPSVTTVSSGFASNTQLNANFTALRDAFDNTLSLDGSSPNAMGADLDLNNNDLLNASVVNTATLKIGGVNVVPSAATALAIKKEFSTVAALLADTGTYSSYAENDYLRVVDGGFTYRVAASSASDQHVTTAGGVKLYVADTFVIDVRAFGPPTSGNAAPQIQAALNLWYNRLRVGGSDRPVVLRIVGQYTVSTGLALTLSANTTASGVIDMSGGRLVSTLTSGTVFRLSARAVNRRIDLVDFSIQGSGTEDVVLEIDGGDANASPAAFLYGINLIRPKIEGFSKIGIDWYNNAFEATIDDPFLACTATTAGAYCLRFRDNVGGATSGNVSSIVIKGGAFRGGINCLYAASTADLKCFGTTFLLAGEECVREDNCVSSSFYGLHIENAWQNGGGGTYMAGIRVDNAPVVDGAYFTSNNGNHNTGVRTFAAGAGADIANVRVTGGVSTAVFVANGADNGSEVRIRGIFRNAVKTQAAASEQIVSFEGRKKMASVAAATGAQNIDVNLYNTFEFTMTGNITLNAPTGMFRGDEITIRLTQGGSGGYTVTWNGVLVRSLNIGAAVGARATYRFYWTGGVWLPIAETAS